MAEEFDDGYKKADKTDITHSNVKKIPKIQVAVAVKDARKKDDMPQVAAAGRGKIAEQILQLAFENGIKVREDSALAEMLTTIEVDSPIPTDAFLAVAEILSYVYQANGEPNPFDALLKDAMSEAEKDAEESDSNDRQD